MLPDEEEVDGIGMGSDNGATDPTSSALREGADVLSTESRASRRF
ncbi:hypothetical protein [Geodermatophilus africanus]|nr:hypothetical protein [Geodermatophilus africanus]